MLSFGTKIHGKLARWIYGMRTLCCTPGQVVGQGRTLSARSEGIESRELEGQGTQRRACRGRATQGAGSREHGGYGSCDNVLKGGYLVAQDLEPIEPRQAD